MRRITNACLEQTLFFSVKEKINPAADRETIYQEFEHYKKQMDHKHMKCRILSREEQGDGTLMVKIRRQYNHYLGR